MASQSENENRTRTEYDRIYAEFVRLLDWWDNSAERLEVLEDIITLRASFLIDRVISGLAIDFDQALDLLRNHNNFTTDRDRQLRDILVAAIDNLVDFAVAEECAMADELPEDLVDEDYEQYEEVCKRYNLTWAQQENSDVAFSAAMAGWWLDLSMDTILTYMTQGDDRVRPWHLELEGISYPKRNFPDELIPPIEYGCRCYLLADSAASVFGALDGQKYIPRVHPVFRESLAKGGRIFSAAHPYFSTPLPAKAKAIAGRIKQKLFLYENNA